MNTNKKIEISVPSNVDEEELRTKLNEFLSDKFPGAYAVAVIPTTKRSKRAPLKQVNNMQLPKRRLVIPPIEDEPLRQSQVKKPIVFGKPMVSSRYQDQADKPFEEPEAREKCLHCCQGPCITTGSFCLGGRAPDIRNHSFRHKDYRKYWKCLKDCGFWECAQYLERKTAAGIPEDELREVMPICVLKDVRKRYPNPPGVPYMGHKRF